MTIEKQPPEAADPGRMTPGGDPLQMTEAEKRVAEWEARHDVAARGHRAGPEVLQHYFAHERLTHASEPPPAGAHSVPAAAQPVQVASAALAPRSRHVLRRLFHRGG